MLFPRGKPAWLVLAIYRRQENVRTPLRFHCSRIDENCFGLTSVQSSFLLHFPLMARHAPEIDPRDLDGNFIRVQKVL